MMNSIFLMLVYVLVPLSFAEGGHVGGGDQCKNEINKHRLAILNWIQKDDAKDLDFSLAKVKGLTYNDPAPAKSYKQAMLRVLEEGNVIVTCYLDPARIHDPVAAQTAQNEGVTYKSVTIGNPPAPTTCINYEDPAGRSHIDCNYDLVMNQNSLGSPDYVMTHHEFASIAGLETRTDSFVSDFSISNQLAQFEHWQSVKLLGPKNTKTSSAFCADKIADLSDILAKTCFSVLAKIPNPIVTSDDYLTSSEIIMNFRGLMSQESKWWSTGFGKTCGGADAQDACLNRCKQMGYLEYCFQACSMF